MNIQLFAVCLLLAVVGTQAKSTFRRHKVARQLPEPVQCEAEKAKCPNSNMCIPESWFCDGDNDCGDDSDEPATCPKKTCQQDEFKCLTRNKCLMLTSVCDGTTQCADGSDEPQDCSTRTCPDGYLKCNSGQCIAQTDYCLIGRGCNDDTPLQTLTVCPEVSCADGHTKCPHLSLCIRNSYFCDGDNDCRDGSDELNCADSGCPAGLFRCNNGQCIDPREFCTGRDGYGCRDNTGTAAICADVPCPPGHSKCASNGVCIDDRQLCDGTAQCSDGSDESAQHCSTPIDCPSGSSRCPNIRRCISAHYFCDMDNDCGDGSDESPAFCGSRTCETNEVRCSNGQCIDRGLFCSNSRMCRDGSLTISMETCPINEIPVQPGGDDGVSGGPSAADMACMTAMMSVEQQCGSNPFGGVIPEEMSADEKRQKFIETDMSELCSPVQQWFNCVERAFGACAGFNSDNPGIQAAADSVRMQLSTGRVVLEYVCEEQVAVINSNKACLLQPAGVTNPGPGQPPNILLLHTSMATCMQHTETDHQNPFCISRELQACVKHVVANQCGDDIAVALDGLADRVRQAAQCPEVTHHGPPSQKKRSGISIHKAFKTFF